MKNFKLTISIFLFTFISTSIYATIYVNNGETLTLGNQTIIESIVVRSGGTFIVNGALIMGELLGPPVEIRIRNGGKMISDNQGGSVRGFTEGSFEGITVDGTGFNGGNTDYALYLDDFSISNAIAGIAISYWSKDVLEETINQRIFIGDTDFFDCHDMARNISQAASSFNRDNSYNSIVFESCNFTSSEFSDSWPLHFNFLKELTFSNCVFDVANDLSLHLNQLRNVSITGCQFINTSADVGIVFHRENYNVEISGNVFYGGGSTSNYAGVAIGASTYSGTIHVGRIDDNTFYDCGAGISIGDADNFVQGYSGIVNNVTIGNNTFINNKVGIQSSESTNLLMMLNQFSGCEVGLLMNSIINGNNNPRAVCNTFNNSVVSILIRDFTLTNFTTAVDMDDNNLFYGTGFDIVNQNNGSFTYNLAVAPYSGKADNTLDVTMVTVNELFDCSRLGFGQDEPNSQSRSSKIEDHRQLVNSPSITVAPNPSFDGYFRLLIESPVERSSIRVLNNLGQEVFAARSIENNSPFMLDISNLSKGVYMLEIETNNSTQSKRLLIQ